MDVASVFKTEVFKPVVITVIPGSFAAFPWIILLNRWIEDLAVYRDKHEAVYFSVVVLLVLAVGLVIEDIGSRVESGWDKRLEASPQFEDFSAVWKAYLKKTFDREPVGQRYLRTILLRMKFELSFAVALIPFVAGMLCLNAQAQWFSLAIAYWGAVALLGLAIYLLRESYNGACLLATVRRWLVEQ